MKRMCALMMAGLGLVFSASAATYHVSPAGDDGHDGLTPATPWRTVGEVNGRAFAAGDQILFLGGAVFTDDGLYFDAGDAGTAGSPIVVGSYGTGRATLQPPANKDAIYIYNTAGLHIRDLILVGPGAVLSDANEKRGVFAYCDRADGAKLDYLRLENLEVSGFYRGIMIGAWHSSYSGFENVTVTGCHLHHNLSEGFFSYGWPGNAAQQSHANIQVLDCEVAYNEGDPTLADPASQHSGSGIIVSGTKGGLVDRCYAHHNGGGAGDNAGGGPVGIWVYAADSVTIQRCLVHDQQTTDGAGDGGGFDIDGGSTHCLVQYCYSYNNEGPGYLIAEYVGASPLQHATFRYNISWRDGRRATAAGSGFAFWSGEDQASECQDVRVHNNLVYSENATGNPCVAYFSGPMADIVLQNNIFVVRGGERFVDVGGNTGYFTFQGNAYWAMDDNWSGGWKWGTDTYTSLADWRAAAGTPETVSGAPVGLQVDPLVDSLVAGAQPTSVAAMEAMTAFKLLAGSPMADAGLDLRTAPFGAIDVGARDFWGQAIPAGAAFDIGPHEADPPTATGVVAFSSATYAVAEDGGSATITVRRTGGSDGAASVQYATSDGTATAGADYTAASGTLNWADGDAADKTFGIPILDDGDVEGDETVNITLANAVGATLGTPAAAVLTIADDESDPQGPYGGTARAIPGRIEAEDYDEGGEGVAYHDADPENRSGAYRTDGVDIKAEGNASNGHCVDWTTVDEWLEYTVDIAAAGTYTFRARVATTNDGKSLRAEIDGVDVTGSVSVPNTGGWSDWGLAEATGVILPEGRRILRIFIETSDFNIDYVEFESVAPTLAFTAAAYAIDEFSAAATIAVRRTGDNADPVSVQYATGDGSATAGADYVAVSGTLSWGAGDSADKTFAVPILNDALLEGDETVVLTLSDAVGAVIGAPQPATLTIIDDESALQGPYGGTPWPIPGRIEAEDYDVGGEGIAYHDTSPGNANGVYRADDVDVKAEWQASNGHCVDWVAGGEWLEYTVEVAETRRYDLSFAMATTDVGRSFRLEVDRVDVTGSVAVPNTGGWSDFQTFVVPGVRLTAGPHILRLVLETNDFNVDFFEAEAVPLPIYTVVFRAAVGGLVDGVAALTQTVTEGGDCTPVTAQPEAGYEFAGWTGDHIGTENPLTLRNVLGDMTVTANFAPAEYVVTFLAEAHGTVNGMAEVTFTVVHGGSAPSVAAVGDEGYSFTGWIGDHAGLENPLTLAGVVDDMTVTATFAINEYRVAFETDGTPGATLSGDLLQTVTHGGDCTPVAVEALPGFEFLGWTGDHVGAENPLTITNVTSDLTVVATFGRRFTVGSTLGIGAELVTGLDAFRLKPKVYAVYRDPVSRIPGKKASLKVLGKIDKANGTDPVVGEWTKKIKLFNGKLFKVRQTLGEGAADWLSAPANQAPLVLDLHLATKEAEPPDQRILGGQLPPPEIDTVEFGLPDAKGNQTLVIIGKWFGTKKPKVWREYTVPEKGPAVKQQKCKVAAPADPAFKDSKGKLSCMQHDTGDSQVIVVVPPPPKGLLNGTLVLGNGVGMAVAVEP